MERTYTPAEIANILATFETMKERSKAAQHRYYERNSEAKKAYAAHYYKRKKEALNAALSGAVAVPEVLPNETTPA